MNNKNVSNKDRNLIKGAIRRVFSRSEFRRQVVDAYRVEHSDPKHPRVKKWSICAECKKHTPSYKIEVDHIDPIVPINTTLEAMSWDTVVDRVFCDANNLNPICKECHKIKTKQERKERLLYKKSLKKS